MKLRNISTSFLIAVITTSGFYPFFKTWPLEEYLYKLTFPVSGKKNEQVVLVMIDDDTVRKMKGFPFKRSEYAKTIAHILKGKPKVIGIDVFFDGIKDLEDDIKLAEVLKNSDVSIVLAVYPLEADSLVLNVISKITAQPLHAYDYKHISYGNVQILGAGAGGVIRVSAIPSFDERQRKYLPFPIMVVSNYLNHAEYKQVPLNDGSLVAMLGDIQIPLSTKNRDIEPSDLLINYIGNRESFDNVLFEKVTEMDPSIYKDKIVLVGVSTEFPRDHFVTPIAEKTPGVVIHANTIDTILNNRFITRVQLHYQLMYIFIFALITSISVIYTRVILTSGVAILVIAGLHILIFRYLLMNYYYLYVSFPLLAILASCVLSLLLKRVLML